MRHDEARDDERYNYADARSTILRVAPGTMYYEATSYGVKFTVEGKFVAGWIFPKPWQRSGPGNWPESGDLAGGG